MSAHETAGLLKRVATTTSSGQGIFMRTVRRALVSAPDDEAIGWVGRFNAMLDAGAYESAAIMLSERALPGVWWIVGKGKMTESEPLYGAQLLFAGEVLAAAEHAEAPALAMVGAILLAMERQP